VHLDKKKKIKKNQTSLPPLLCGSTQAYLGFFFKRKITRPYEKDNKKHFFLKGKSAHHFHTIRDIFHGFSSRCLSFIVGSA